MKLNITKIASFLALILIFSDSLKAQNITGSVKDKNGLAISNALVSQSANVFTFTKTDKNGLFTILGSVPMNLSVSALGYETLRDITVTSVSNFNVQLSVDQALADNVYHINFDHLRPGANYRESELKVDFPVANGIGFADDLIPPTELTNRVSVDPIESVGGKGSSLKVKFPKNQLKTANSGIDVRIPLAGTYKLNPFKSDELYLSYWVKFSSDFDFSKCGGKLPSLGGDYVVGNLRWKGRIMWRNGGSIQFYPELNGGEDNFKSDFDRFWGAEIENNGSICTNKFSPYLRNGVWHNIELHYKFETPGKSDGYFEGWVDGQKGYKITNSDKFGFWRPKDVNDDITINYLLLSTFLGGSDMVDYGHTKDVYAWFDEFKVSTKRVNEYNLYNLTTANEFESKMDDEIVLYPNPTSKDLKVTLPKTVLNTTVYIRNAEGNIMSSHVLSSGSTSILDLEYLPLGLYFLEVKSDSDIFFKRFEKIF